MGAADNLTWLSSKADLYFDLFLNSVILEEYCRHYNNMDREILVKLTNDLYKLTLFFPKKEPLRFKVREVAVNFLTNPSFKDLDTLIVFFDVILIQNWVSPSEVMALKGKYESLRSEISVPEFIQRPVAKVANNSQGLQDRQEKILAFLKEKGKAQVWQIKEILPQVTKRTLRRDFEYLLSTGTIERMGERNNTFYQLKATVL